MASKNNHFKRSHEDYLRYGEKSKQTQKESWKNKTEEEKKAWSQKRKDLMLSRSPEQIQQWLERTTYTNLNKSDEEKEQIHKRRSESCKKLFRTAQQFKR